MAKGNRGGRRGISKNTKTANELLNGKISYLEIPKETSADKLGEEFNKIKDSYDTAIKMADKWQPKIADYYENGAFLPHSAKERYTHSNDYYALNNGYYGGFKKINETATTVTFQNGKIPFKVEKSEFRADKIDSLKQQRNKDIVEAQKQALYLLGKKNGLKVTKKMKTPQLKALIQKDERLKQIAKDGGFFSLN